MIPAERAYQVWLKLVASEELSKATLIGRHRELAERYGLEDIDQEILDQFHAEPGFRWNIENLRFRSAWTAGTAVSSYLPRTTAILTENREMWLQDMMYEYLAHHEWDALGFELAEVERFADYVRERVCRRRIVPRHLQAVLDFELAEIALIKRTKDLRPGDWPDRQVPADDELLAADLGWAPAVSLVECAYDIGQLDLGQDGSEPIGVKTSDEPVVSRSPTWFVLYIGSLSESIRHQKLSSGAAMVLDGFRGGARVDELTGAIAAEFGVDAAPMLALVRTWLAAGVLAPAGGE